MKLLKQAVLALLVMLPPIWMFLLHDYQKERILVLFDPQMDPFGRDITSFSRKFQ